MSEPVATPAAPAPLPKKRGGPPKPLIILLILAGVGYFVWKNYLQPVPLPEGVVQLSGLSLGKSLDN